MCDFDLRVVSEAAETGAAESGSANQLTGYFSTGKTALSSSGLPAARAGARLPDLD